MQRFIQALVPFIMLGIALTAFAFGIMILAYLFMIGATIGLVLFIVSRIRQMLFPIKTPTTKQKTGRVIDSDDWRVL